MSKCEEIREGKCEEIKESIKKDLGLEELEMYEKKLCAKTNCHRETVFLIDGKIVKPVKIGHSRTYTTFYKWYRKRDIANSDTILEIYVSNSGNHHCSITIKRFNLRSLRKALSIHSCPKINDQLLRYIEENDVQLNV